MNRNLHVTMTRQEFESILSQKYGDRIRYREHGKHGWSSVDDILDQKPGGKPGPHWIDATVVPTTDGRMVGTYHVDKGVAIFYPIWDRATQSWVPGIKI